MEGNSYILGWVWVIMVCIFIGVFIYGMGIQIDPVQALIHRGTAIKDLEKFCKICADYGDNEHCRKLALIYPAVIMRANEIVKHDPPREQERHFKHILNDIGGDLYLSSVYKSIIRINDGYINIRECKNATLDKLYTKIIDAIDFSIKAQIKELMKDMDHLIGGDEE